MARGRTGARVRGARFESHDTRVQGTWSKTKGICGVSKQVNSAFDGIAPFDAWLREKRLGSIARVRDHDRPTASQTTARMGEPNIGYDVLFVSATPRTSSSRTGPERDVW